MDKQRFIWLVAVLIVLLPAALIAQDHSDDGDAYDWKTWGAVTDTLVWSTAQPRLTLSSPFTTSAGVAKRPKERISSIPVTFSTSQSRSNS